MWLDGLKNKKAFTLIELLVITSIIAIMSVIVFANYRAGERGYVLQSATHKLAQDLRRAEEMAMSAREFNGSMPKGYGVYIDINEPDHYILFADLDGGTEYDGSLELVEDIKMEKGVRINSLLASECPGGICTLMSITFVPPDPYVYIKVKWVAGDWTEILSTSGSIELTNDTQLRRVTVNRAGLIETD